MDEKYVYTTVLTITGIDDAVPLVVTVINPAWLHTLAPSMCTFSKPRTAPSSMQVAGATTNIVNPIFGGKFTLPPVRL